MLSLRLLGEGYKVTVVDNLRFGQSDVKSTLEASGVKFILDDVRKLSKQFLSQYQIIIPLAAIVGAPICDENPEEAYQVNLNSVERLIQMIRSEVLVVFPNTNSGYGINQESSYCVETSPLRPISLYGKLKVAAEEYILQNHSNSITLRLATVFGVSHRHREELLVNNFVLKAFLDRRLDIYEGHFRRNFVHVLDVVDGFVFVMNNSERLRGNVFNLGQDSANMTKLELAQKIKIFFPDLMIEESLQYKDPDQRDYLVSNAKIHKAGFTPQISLEQGIKELKAYYEQTYI